MRKLKLSLLLLFIVSLIGCNQIGIEGNDKQQEDDTAEAIGNEEDTISTANSDGNEEELVLKIDIKEIDNQQVVSVEHLMEKLGGTYNYDEINKTIRLNLYEQEFYLVYGVPVLDVNGEYLPIEDVLLLLDEEEASPYVTISFIESGLGTEIVDIKEENQLSFVWEDEVVETLKQPNDVAFDIYSLSVEEMVDYLSFLDKPIEEASVSTITAYLPGAPRGYRSGTHEGIDWYDLPLGSVITTATPVFAMGEGIVVRVDQNFVEYVSPIERNKDLQISAELGLTPTYILDRLRGKQVWVQYPNGVMNHFAHLDSIPEGLNVGDKVDANKIIGYIGNSGTSNAVDNDGGGLHLHQEILIYGELFWKPYSPKEIRTILTHIWE